MKHPALKRYILIAVLVLIACGAAALFLFVRQVYRISVESERLLHVNRFFARLQEPAFYEKLRALDDGYLQWDMLGDDAKLTYAGGLGVPFGGEAKEPGSFTVLDSLARYSGRLYVEKCGDALVFTVVGDDCYRTETHLPPDEDGPGSIRDDFLIRLTESKRGGLPAHPAFLNGKRIPDDIPVELDREYLLRNPDAAAYAAENNSNSGEDFRASDPAQDKIF